MTTNTLASVTKNGQDTSTKPNYSVKNIEPVVIGTDVQARIFTLAPSEFIPWHCHSESTDHYFVLRGTLNICTRDPNDERMPRWRPL
jgi:quercetin dioxygenase-like cupin family protein